MRNFGEIHKVASHRYHVIDNVLVERCVDGTARAIATNGYIFAVRNVELEAGDQPGLVPAKALEAAYDECGRVVLGKLKVRIPVLDESGERVVHRAKARADEFPPYRLIQDQAAASAEANGTVKVMLNAELLRRLSDALNDDPTQGIEIEIPIPEEAGELNLKPMRVIGAHGRGIIMPIDPKRGIDLVQDSESEAAQ